MKATIILDPYNMNRLRIVKFIHYTSGLSLKESLELFDKAPINNYKITYTVMYQMGGLRKYFNETCVDGNGSISLRYYERRDLNLVKLGITTNIDKIVNVLISTYGKDDLIKRLIENVDSDVLVTIIDKLDADMQENEKL